MAIVDKKSTNLTFSSVFFFWYSPNEELRNRWNNYNDSNNWEYLRKCEIVWLAHFVSVHCFGIKIRIIANRLLWAAYVTVTVWTVSQVLFGANEMARVALCVCPAVICVNCQCNGVNVGPMLMNIVLSTFEGRRDLLRVFAGRFSSQKFWTKATAHWTILLFFK